MEPISVKAIVRKHNSVLFLTNPRGELELPGGRPESGESLETALAREFEEECGVAITSATYVGSRSCEVVTGKRVLLVFFACSISSDSPILSNEHTAYEWIDVTAGKPINMPNFYWLACAQPKEIAPQPNRPPMAASHYPLFTGDDDRQRLSITSEIYNAASIEFLRRYTPSTGHMLDVGCGHGQITQWLATNHPDATVIGMDNNTEQLAMARSFAMAADVKNITFEHGDINDIFSVFPPTPTFDLITCRFTLLHVAHRAAAIDALVQLLTPSGVLILEEPSLESLFCIPNVASFERANAAISAYGRTQGIRYDCIDDIWSLITDMNVKIQDARFSQPTIWKKEHKRLVSLSFSQFSPRLVSAGILDASSAQSILQSLDNEFMSDLVISGGLRTLQIAISKHEVSP
ncbi:methyltransferase type 11 [Pandoraea capi]|uniref:Methyltransferase type 11 n=1 Tax=Pandoraea capi TaxID=2508286 RepID=A0ABY6VTS7_9BURK|nr:methyltransferase domain-containing protein [Pandoraea capi]VVD86620.1 methyltransferase type 11 [Pandoraea capi]